MARLLSALERQTLFLAVTYRACEKLSVLNNECQFAIFLQSVRHGQKTLINRVTYKTIHGILGTVGQVQC